MRLTWFAHAQVVMLLTCLHCHSSNSHLLWYAEGCCTGKRTRSSNTDGEHETRGGIVCVVTLFLV